MDNNLLVIRKVIISCDNFSAMMTFMVRFFGCFQWLFILLRRPLLLLFEAGDQLAVVVEVVAVLVVIPAVVVLRLFRIGAFADIKEDQQGYDGERHRGRDDNQNGSEHVTDLLRSWTSSAEASAG